MRRRALAALHFVVELLEDYADCVCRAARRWRLRIEERIWLLELRRLVRLAIEGKLPLAPEREEEPGR